MRNWQRTATLRAPRAAASAPGTARPPQPGAALANGLLERLVNTATLCLANNRLTGVEDLGVLPQLRLLDLSHNALSATPDLRGLTCLAALDLSHNSLPSLSTARLPHSLRFLQVAPRCRPTQPGLPVVLPSPPCLSAARAPTAWCSGATWMGNPL